MTYGTTGIYLRRHLGLRLLLLWYHGKTNRTPNFVPWDQLWQQNTSCLPHTVKSREVAAIATVVVMGDALEHTTVTV